MEFNDVSATRGGRVIWSRATFEVPAGGIVAVIGANGSGKTTLLQMILGLVPVPTGQLRVFGEQPGADNRIGYVPQNYAGSAGEAIRAVDSVTLGLTGHRWALRRTATQERGRVQDCLKAVGAEAFAHHRLSTLSGGQRQRVAIAEALVASPRMLILDEPLASLDMRSQAEMVRLLAQLHREIDGTIVVAAHDLNPLLPILSSAIYLLDAQAHHAPVAQVIDDALLTRLYDTPMQVLRAPTGESFIRNAL